MHNYPKIENFEIIGASKNYSKYLIILLHGYKMSAHDMIKTFGMYLSTGIVGSTIIAIESPFLAEDNKGFDWFKLNKENNLDSIIEIATIAANSVRNFIEEQAEIYQVENEKIFLVGYSQGAKLALHTSFFLPYKIGAVISISGNIISYNHIQNALYKTPIYFIHGEKDEIIAAKDMLISKLILLQLGFEVYDHIFAGHKHRLTRQFLNLTVNIINSKILETEPETLSLIK